jgi:hypothetical protein
VRKLSAGRAIRVGEMEIIPIELSHVGGEQTPAGLMAFGMKEPVAVVIRSPRGEWALDLNGNEIIISDAWFPG